MAIFTQTTYTCRCGKKRELPKPNGKHVTCGCGRAATADKDGKVTITDKPKRK